MNQNTTTYLTFAMMYPLLAFLSFFVANNADGIPSLSFGGVSGVFMGENAIWAFLFTGLTFAGMICYHFYLFPRFIGNPEMHLVLIVLPETIAVLGFVLAYLARNPWVSLPFVALGFMSYAYAFFRINASAPQA
jgi:hypothetical protein